MIPTKSGNLYTVLVRLSRSQRRVCDYPARAESAETLRDQILADLAKDADMPGSLVHVRIYREVEEGDIGEPTLEIDEEAVVGAELQTDPYGELEYAVGSGDDFWCFDFALDAGDSDREGWAKLHAVINSETGHFIMNAFPPVFLPLQADVVESAVDLVSAALDWCAENNVRHHFKGWNQDPAYFVRSVRDAVEQAKGAAYRRTTRRRPGPKWLADLTIAKAEGRTP